jgi:hypothetical protein
MSATWSRSTSSPCRPPAMACSRERARLARRAGVTRRGGVEQERSFAFLTFRQSGRSSRTTCGSRGTATSSCARIRGTRSFGRREGGCREHGRPAAPGHHEDRHRELQATAPSARRTGPEGAPSPSTRSSWSATPRPSADTAERSRCTGLQLMRASASTRHPNPGAVPGSVPTWCGGLTRPASGRILGTPRGGTPYLE